MTLQRCLRFWLQGEDMQFLLWTASRWIDQVEAVRYFWRTKARAKVGKCMEVDGSGFCQKFASFFFKGNMACSAKKFHWITLHRGSAPCNSWCWGRVTDSVTVYCLLFREKKFEAYRHTGTFTTSSMSHRSSAVNLGQVKQRQLLAEAKWGTKIWTASEPLTKELSVFVEFWYG